MLLFLSKGFALSAALLASSSLVERGLESVTGPRHALRHALRWVVLVTCFMVASVGGAASLSTPTGWVQGAAADDRAHRRADAWAAAWGADVRGVMSTRSADDFVETLAVLDVAGPLPAETLAEVTTGREWLSARASAALGAAATLEPDTAQLILQDEPGVAVLRAKFIVGEEVAWVAAAPTGARHLMVVLLVPSAEEVLHAGVFEDALDDLEGLRAPIAPFAHGSARTIAYVLWFVVGGAFAVLWTRRSLPMPGARAAGRQVAGILVGTALLVSLVAGLLLDGSAVELSLAGTSPWGLGLQLGLGGLVTAAVVLAGTDLWERRLRPVASAPGVGSFAVSGASTRRRGPDSAGVPLEGSTTNVVPAVTGDTHVGPPPAQTGNTQVGPAPAQTGNTQVGPPPAKTGNTKVGPAPVAHDMEEEPPVREVISGDFEVDSTLVARRLHPSSSPEDALQRPRLGTVDGRASLLDPTE